MKILIDDIRDSSDVDIIIRTPETAETLLTMLVKEDIHIDELYLDHDLGDASKKNGYQILIEQLFNNEIFPSFIKVVSSNPVGRKNIWAACDNADYTFNVKKQAWCK